ncbi:MAG: PfkB family carbohydrate kinase [Planctomycetota bacterium]|nr:PfkB family carbohydrate kinase [Planctomycetota bacterium]
MCTIAGIDTTRGAGRDVDLAVFAAFGAEGRAVITATAAQSEDGVHAVTPRPAAAVAAELAAVLSDPTCTALKSGMLATEAIVRAVGAVLGAQKPRPFVVDPVLAAGAGGALLDEAGVEALLQALGPHTTLLTPNLPEAARLLGQSAVDARSAALALHARGWPAVLVKGGHSQAEGAVVDVLATARGSAHFERPRVAGGNVRGTGCALSAAIAAALGAGLPLEDAVRQAGDWLHALLREAHAAGRGTLSPEAVTLPPPRPGE